MAKKVKKPELLVGAGSFSSVIAATKNGADAVYFGIKGYNMRDLGTNFSAAEMGKLLKYLHERGVRGYLALNTIIFEEELKRVEKILKKAKKASVDGIILSDLAVLKMARELGLNCFLSTQASVSNSVALEEYKKLGAKRIILARELSLGQVKKIRKKAEKVGVEIEAFVHGAMCISVSGRCFLSHELFGRSANRGKCLQPCRRPFFVKGTEKGNAAEKAFFLDGNKPNYTKKEVEVRGDTILSAKDMKSIEFMDKIVGAGIDSVKIEGRTKPGDYVAVTTKCYREAIDAVAEGSFGKEKVRKWDEELEKVYNRGFSTGFWLKRPGKKELSKGEGSFQKQKRVNVGKVQKYYAKACVAEVKLFDSVEEGDRILFEGKTTYLEQPLDSMEIAHKKRKKAGKGREVGIKVKERVRPNDKVFVLKNKE